MKRFQLYPAVVVDNDNPDKNGKVQVKIEHMHSDVKSEDLPWAQHFYGGTGGGTDQGTGPHRGGGG